MASSQSTQRIISHAGIAEIVACIDKYLEQTNKSWITPNAANALLARQGLLADSSSRPGLPLRRLLRADQIPNAYQNPPGKNGRWYIPHSGRTYHTSAQPQADELTSMSQQKTDQVGNEYQSYDLPAEAVRGAYLPANVKVLFIGESPPAGGTFFYYGNSNLARYTREAFEAALDRHFSSMDAFLEFFMKQGCYLDDLCLVPVNNMNKKQRGTERQRGVAPLADRITNYNPDSIVVVMKGIEGNVFSALYGANLSSIPTRALPFPSHGNQRRYVNELVDTLRDLQAQGLFG